jgi:hypothetical protein
MCQGANHERRFFAVRAARRQKGIPTGIRRPEPALTPRLLRPPSFLWTPPLLEAKPGAYGGTYGSQTSKAKAIVMREVNFRRDAARGLYSTPGGRIQSSTYHAATKEEDTLKTHQTEHKFIREAWHAIAHRASFEWLLTPTRPNGGDVVLARSLAVAVLLCGIALILWNAVDPDLTGPMTWKGLGRQLVDAAPWFAAAAGAVYAALYARFSSQWGYLAALYNQIKQAEIELTCVEGANADAAWKKLAQWKAGYVEDAQDLHLHTKGNIAGVIHFWGKDPEVASAFANWTPGGARRWNQVQAEVAAAYLNTAGKYK